MQSPTIPSSVVPHDPEKEALSHVSACKAEVVESELLDGIVARVWRHARVITVPVPVPVPGGTYL